MGKKKDKKHKHKHGDGHADFAVPPQVMGIAATIARQVTTPQARQMLAGALVAAAGAIAAGGQKAAAPVPPVPPVPPVAPIPPEVAVAAEPPKAAEPAKPGYAPDFTSPHFTVPPEAARVIGAVASGLERWAQAFGKPKIPPTE